MGYYRWPEQLYVCTDKKKQKGICNCTMCPQLSVRGQRYCSYMKGNIREPKISWCNSGIAFMWLDQANETDAEKFVTDPRITPGVASVLIEQESPKNVIKMLAAFAGRDSK